MPLDRAALDDALDRVNRPRRPDQRVRVESFDGARFTLSFPNRAMPEGQCIDQDFTEVQWALHEKDALVTSIVGGRHDPETDRYFMDYELVEWD